MDKTELSVLARNVAKGRWFVVFICFLIMSLAGGTYIFGIYSEAIKTVLGYDQETITTLGFFKDLGGNVGIVSGLINEVAPPWVVLGIGAIMNITGYLMIWLSVTQRIAKPKTWQMYLYICIGANSQTFANTGALVTCVKNFPHSRGSVLGILKGFVGLSGAIFTQIYHAIYGQDDRGIILLLGILPSALSLLVMLIVRPTKAVTEKNELKRFYNFLYIALFLAGFLMVMIVVENRVKSFPQSGYQIVAALAILFLLSNLAIVVKAEMDKMKLPNWVSENSEKTNVQENRQSELTDMGINGVDKEEPKSVKSQLKKIFKGPARGNDFTIPQALVSVDMIILFSAATCGIGATLTAIDNMGQIGSALSYTPVNISTFVSLISIWSFLGRVVAGFLSEFLLQKYKFPRSLMFTIVLLMGCVGHVFIAFALPGSLYVASIAIGFSFGAQWPILLAVISELFGLKYYATLYNFGAAASPLGSYLLSVRVAGALYDKEARKQNFSESLLQAALAPAPAHNKLTCVGHECFRLSFIIMTVVTLFGALISGILVFRTRKFYRSDIYAKFRVEPVKSEGEDTDS
ncbi:hypothetical protein SUGI_0479390 [Cryptomeria japonica]|uniref:uncharacterized protein LOC131072810 n=1 Tax=Cryptomeria japonica TaxID=3369 RepID=UPI002408CC5C|nr:uncharacterized protein LOC131072810 [Cryptomeria japonica]GLJ25050.1 hypothetical protein SUGI_0479390 [Cryptomeria japonica]